MNILFLTLAKIRAHSDRGIYPDLIRELAKRGHSVYLLTPHERSDKDEFVSASSENGVHIIRARIEDYFNRGLIKKGISAVTLSGRYIEAIETNCRSVKFDLILYSTPPVTFNKVIKRYKQRDNAKTYLLLKDIWPQGPADMGALSPCGIKGIVYRHFLKSEKELYALSDVIGCMSEANIAYVRAHNPELDPAKIRLSANSISPGDMSVSAEERERIRATYGIPSDKKVFIYGGNFGRPQGVDFIVKCLREAQKEDVIFLMVGEGTDYHKVESYVKEERPSNVMLKKRLPKEDYDILVGACDAGMIFLDHRFTIPNFPSRLLSYMQAKIPVLAVTDTSSDVGQVITGGGFGWWCESNDAEGFVLKVREALASDLALLGIRGFEYLKAHYDAADRAREILAGPAQERQEAV